MLRSSSRAGVLFLLLSFLNGAVHGVEIWEFTGDSCGACRQMDATIAEIRSMGVPVRQINVQRDPDLARNLDVQYIPCFVAVADGKPFDRITGIASTQQLLDMFHRAGASATTPNIVRGQSQSAPAHGSRNAELKNAVIPVSSGARSLSESMTSDISPAEQLAMAATVRIKVIDAKGHSFGTGTVVHTTGQDALILTCGHIFRDSAGKGQIVCDILVDQQHHEVPARLVSYDLRRDVGLISLQPGGTVYPVKVGGTGVRQRPGDAVFAIGCSHGSTPTVNRNQIRAVNRYHGPANLVVGGRPVDGRSGGGLFDMNGTLIGVCNAADQSEDEGLYAALGPIHAEFDNSGLSFIYRDSTATLPAQPSHSTIVPNGNLAVVATIPASAQIPQADSSREVIVIVREKGELTQDGQAFVLDHPSDGLLQVLSHELAKRGAHATTQLHISTGPGQWSPLHQR